MFSKLNTRILILVPMAVAINFGSVMTMKPNFFLLDEPSAGMGEQQREQLVEDILALQKSDSNFLIVSHDPVFIQA